jgi:RAB protein geranylgeranyltransferase component A
VFAIADEDLERENEQKTSSVHFLRFELTKEMAEALKYGVALSIGVDHPAYRAALEPVAPATRAALVKDLA